MGTCFGFHGKSLYTSASLWSSRDRQDTDISSRVPVQCPSVECWLRDLMDQGFLHSWAVSPSGEPGRRGQEAKWRTGLSERDWTVSRKRYFIGVACVYKSGLTLGKEVCRLLSLNARDMCIFCVFLSGFPLLRKQNSGDNGMSKHFQSKI